MRRSALLLALALSHASAANIDCNKLTLDTNGYVAYQTVEVFPDPVQRSEVKLYTQTKPFRLDLCGVTVTADSKQYAFKTKDVKSLATVLGTGLSWPLRVIGVRQQGGRTTYPEAAQLNIELPDGLFHKNVTISGYFAPGLYLPGDALMAIRIDGGKLLPLLYNGSFRNIEVSPRMNTMELFIKSNRPVLWERMTLDVKNSRMTFTKKFTFPKR